MRRKPLALLFTFCAWLGLQAQTASDPNEGVAIAPDAGTGGVTLSWWGRARRVYFVQYTDDLTGPWTFTPIVEVGGDHVVSYGFVASGTKGFWRLRVVDSSSANPALDDFDGDGLTNGFELQAGTDPLDPDSNHNGVGDADEDSDGDGLNNREEAILGTDPKHGNAADSASLINLQVLTPQLQRLD